MEPWSRGSRSVFADFHHFDEKQVKVKFKLDPVRDLHYGDSDPQPNFKDFLWYR
jgi:hypothetical protein